MGKHNITDYMDLCAIFVRIKVHSPEQDFIVLPGTEDGSDEKARIYYN